MGNKVTYYIILEDINREKADRSLYEEYINFSIGLHYIFIKKQTLSSLPHLHMPHIQKVIILN